MNKPNVSNIKALGLSHIMMALIIFVGVYFIFDVAEPEKVFSVSAILMSMFGLVGLCLFISGSAILLRKRWALFFMPLSAISVVMFFPVGTALGIWTFMIWRQLRALRKSKR